MTACGTYTLASTPNAALTSHERCTGDASRWSERLPLSRTRKLAHHISPSLSNKTDIMPARRDDHSSPAASLLHPLITASPSSHLSRRTYALRNSGTRARTPRITSTFRACFATRRNHVGFIFKLWVSGPSRTWLTVPYQSARYLCSHLHLHVVLHNEHLQALV